MDPKWSFTELLMIMILDNVLLYTCALYDYCKVDVEYMLCARASSGRDFVDTVKLPIGAPGLIHATHVFRVMLG